MSIGLWRLPAADLGIAERLLEATERIRVATRVVTSWTTPASRASSAPAEPLGIC
ncbi:hypothetical protein [Agrococcus sp. TSP3-2-1]|uniref:hypothetical protein n=1 Tax=Agrococcus sp. TSP3-2-1 TaxID=2804583 RepID=UPI003CE8D1A0